MANAKALFTKHWKQFHNGDDVNQFSVLIYAACIIAEAIRNEQEDMDSEIRFIEVEKLA